MTATLEPTISEKANCAQTSSVVSIQVCCAPEYSQLLSEPVTSIVSTQDTQTLLVTTLDSHIRLIDMTSGKMLNDFTGHTNSSYRCRACFGHGEATVICGDEQGMVWAWDLLDVSALLCLISDADVRLLGKAIATESSA